MPPPPPPCPPMGPPPPPMMGPGFGKASKSTGKAPDRNALLSSIQQGARLKKVTQVNDRSAPIVGAVKESSASNNNNNGSGSNGNNRSNSNPSSGPVGLGGLFANGMPKLKKTGNTIVTGRSDAQDSSVNNSAKSRSSSNAMTSSTNTASASRVSSDRSQPTFPSGGHNYTPQLQSNLSSNRQFQTLKPSPPSKPPNGPPVQRSNSQSGAKNGQGKPLVSVRPAPVHMNTRPPPPPSKASVTSNGFSNQPTLPSKPSNMGRRPSLTNGNDVSNSRSNSFSDGPPPLPSIPPPALPPPNGSWGQSAVNKPPPPTRNGSQPRHSNEHSSRGPLVAAVSPMVQHGRTSHSSPRPPLAPPPPPPSIPSRNQGQSDRSSGQSAFPLPPSQTSIHPAAGNRAAFFAQSSQQPVPPAPQRHTSITKIDLEARFGTTFKQAFQLPPPEPLRNKQKTYPSVQLQQSQRSRRGPPPPVPQNGPGQWNNGSQNNSNNSLMVNGINKSRSTSTPSLVTPQFTRPESNVAARC